MPPRWFTPLGAVLALSLALYQHHLRTASAPTATTYHCYAGVRTLLDDQPATRCFGVRDGVFSSVFTADEVAALGEGDYVVHNHDSFAIPGLWDGHGHILTYGEFLHSVDLFGAASFEEVRRRIDDYVGSHPGAGTNRHWIRGVGWDQVVLGRMPTADDLDSDSLRGLAIMLDRTDIHCHWVSHAVLLMLDPSELDRIIPGGEVVREPALGVFCDNAMDMVLARWPAPDQATTAQYARTAMRELNAVGIVGVHDAMANPKDIDLFDKLAAADGDLSVRIYAMLKCEVMNAFCIDDARRIERDDGMLSARSVKLFGDGALGSWGAAMIEPYSDKADTAGTLIANATELASVTEAWALAGYQVNIHAIGDLANRIAVDAIENALRVLSSGSDSVADLAAFQSKLRFRIEHAQIVDPADQERMLALGIIPSIQPTHATSDMAYAHARLGTRRIAESAYRMRSLLDLDICLGSDFPVEPPSPFRGMYAAVTRRSPATGRGVVDGEGDWSAGWHVEEAITLEQALRGFTTNVAKAGFMEGKAGVIAPGAWADWVVLEEELSEDMDIEKLRTMGVRETWVGGKKVYPVVVEVQQGWWDWLPQGVREYLR